MNRNAPSRPPTRRDPFVSPPRRLLARLLTSEPGTAFVTALFLVAVVLFGAEAGIWLDEVLP